MKNYFLVCVEQDEGRKKNSQPSISIKANLAKKFYNIIDTDILKSYFNFWNNYDYEVKDITIKRIKPENIVKNKNRTCLNCAFNYTQSINDKNSTCYTCTKYEGFNNWQPKKPCSTCEYETTPTVTLLKCAKCRSQKGESGLSMEPSPLDQ